MFENLLYQSTTSLIRSDIKRNNFPGAVLYSGPEYSGKLTCALETSRILSCKNEPKAHWNCECSSCKLHRGMLSTNLLICGPRDCVPEIEAASKSFCDAVRENSPLLKGARYFFVRSVRKLTCRFNQILWEGDDKLNKIAAITGDLDEYLETLDFPHELPGIEVIEKTTKKIVELSRKLQEQFLYDSIPVSQIRNINVWARMKTVEGSKTIIIENADRMLESVRNALLKILEEPPKDTVFILTTSRRNAVMPTILSRVRTYSFNERSEEEQSEVIRRVFHNSSYKGIISEYLLTFLPVTPKELRNLGRAFFLEIASGHIPSVQDYLKECKNFDSRVMLKIFLTEILSTQKPVLKYAQGAEASSQSLKAVQDCWNNITVYNQSLQSSFEILVRELSRINKIHGNVFKCITM